MVYRLLGVQAARHAEDVIQARVDSFEKEIEVIEQQSARETRALKDQLKAEKAARQRAEAAESDANSKATVFAEAVEQAEEAEEAANEKYAVCKQELEVKLTHWSFACLVQMCLVSHFGLLLFSQCVCCMNRLCNLLLEQRKAVSRLCRKRKSPNCKTKLLNANLQHSSKLSGLSSV